MANWVLKGLRAGIRTTPIPIDPRMRLGSRQVVRLALQLDLLSRQTPWSKDVQRGRLRVKTE